MEITVRAKDVQAAKAKLGALKRELRAAVKHAVQRSMDTAELTMKRKLAEKSHPRKTKTPSLPGEPPALITGAMRRSVRQRGPTPDGPDAYVGRVGPRAAQSRIQELGGYVRKAAHKGHIGPMREEGYIHLPARPYAAPTEKEIRGKVEAIFEQEIEAAIRRVLGV